MISQLCLCYVNYCSPVTLVSIGPDIAHLTPQNIQVFITLNHAEKSDVQLMKGQEVFAKPLVH